MKIGILYKEKLWLVEQLQKFLRQAGVIPVIIPFGKKADADIVIVRGGPGIKSEEEWSTLINMVKDFEKNGIKCINSSSAIENGLDKYKSYLLFKKYNIPTPETFFCRSIEDGKDLVKKFPLVAKPLRGSEGIGVLKVESLDDLNKIKYRPFLLQQYIHHGGMDARVYVAGDRAVGAISRKSSGFITNLAQGGVPERHRLSEDESMLVLKAVNAIGADVATVDIVNAAGKCFVLEVNVLPLFSERLAAVAGFSFPEEIVKYILTKYNAHKE